MLDMKCRSCGHDAADHDHYYIGASHCVHKDCGCLDYSTKLDVVVRGLILAICVGTVAYLAYWSALVAR